MQTTRTTLVTVLLMALAGLIFFIPAAATGDHEDSAASRMDILDARVYDLEARLTRLEDALLEADIIVLPASGSSLTGDLAGLPEAVLEAIEIAHPGGHVTEAEYDDGVWEIEVSDGGEDYEMEITNSGRIVEDDD